MLVEEYGIAIGINHHQTGWPARGFIRNADRLNALAHDLALNIADILELAQGVGAAVPTRIEGQDIVFKHALEQTDDGFLIFQDEVVFSHITGEDAEAQFFIKFL